MQKTLLGLKCVDKVDESKTYREGFIRRRPICNPISATNNETVSKERVEDHFGFTKDFLVEEQKVVQPAEAKEDED